MVTDTQTIVLVAGMAGIVLFMMSGSNKSEEAQLGPTIQPWYPTEALPEIIGDAPTKKKGPDVQQKIDANVEEMQKYAEKVVNKYIQKKQRTFDMIDASAMDGPMRNDLKDRIVELLQDCQIIGDRWRVLLEQRAALVPGFRLEGFNEFGLIQDMTRDYWLYNMMLDTQTALINDEQARDDTPRTVQYFIQNVVKYQDLFLSRRTNVLNWNQSVDIEMEILPLQNFLTAGPADPSPNQLMIENQEHEGGMGGLPSARTDNFAEVSHSSQPGFVANAPPASVKRDLNKAATEAANGKSSAERMHVKGGGPRPEPENITILDDDTDVDRGMAFNTVTVPTRLPPVAPPGGVKPDVIGLVREALPAPQTPKRSKKRERDMDSAPPIHTSQLTSMPEQKAKRGKSTPDTPSEFAQNARQGGRDSTLPKHEKPEVNPAFAHKIGVYANEFTKAEGRGDENDMGVNYYKALHVTPTGDSFGKYFSQIIENDRSATRDVFFRRYKGKGTNTDRDAAAFTKGKMTIGEIADMVLSPEYIWYKGVMQRLEKRFLEWIRDSGGRPQGKIRNQKTYEDAVI